MVGTEPVEERHAIDAASDKLGSVAVGAAVHDMYVGAIYVTYVYNATPVIGGVG